MIISNKMIKEVVVMWGASEEREIISIMKKRRRVLRQYPELSREEQRTSVLISDYLLSIGIEVIKLR
jgi:metal-dependent amidase/aminoacylase/carboxypeptidase family protein